MSELKLRPLRDKILIKPAKEQDKSRGGILLPQTTEEKPERGEVLAVGEGKLLENGSYAKMSVKVGDQVIFKKYSPDEIKIDEEEYLIISEDDILAIIN